MFSELKVSFPGTYSVSEKGLVSGYKSIKYGPLYAKVHHCSLWKIVLANVSSTILALLSRFLLLIC